MRIVAQPVNLYRDKNRLIPLDSMMTKDTRIIYT